MDEKVLIKSEMDSKVKASMFTLAWTLFGIGVAALLALFLPQTTYKGQDTGWGLIIGSYGDLALPYTLLISGGVFMVIGLILLLCFRALAMCELEVTEHNVKGKTVGGKVVVLPLHQISTYSTKKKNSTIFVATSSGIAKFSLIKNYEEIGKILAEKINSKQENTVVAPAAAPTSSNSMDDLVKLKNLLDSGIITQEEFDAKKKQLLNL